MCTHSIGLVVLLLIGMVCTVHVCMSSIITRSKLVVLLLIGEVTDLHQADHLFLDKLTYIEKENVKDTNKSKTLS